MKIVTSYGPNRPERQQACLRSWVNAGYEVFAVQTASEIAPLRQLFPQAHFIETDLVADLFGKPSFVRIKALTDQANGENILIVNSDIHLAGDLNTFRRQWEPPEPKVLKMGIRWDVHPRYPRQTKIFKWGIDAFLITPAIAADLPDIGLAIGCPAWDYWIPYHLNSLGYKFVTNKDYHLAHLLHPRSWSTADYETGLGIMKQHYGIDKVPLAQFIQEITGRKHLKHWNPRI